MIGKIYLEFLPLTGLFAVLDRLWKELANQRDFKGLQVWGRGLVRNMKPVVVVAHSAVLHVMVAAYGVRACNHSYCSIA